MMLPTGDYTSAISCSSVGAGGIFLVQMLSEQSLEVTLKSGAGPELIGERYVVMEQLGGGAMGVVYEAYDRQLDRKVALKFLRQADGPGVSELSERMLREAKALARISHPNVVVVHDFGVHDRRVYLVMEIVRGTTLSRWQQSRAWREVVDVYLGAGSGLFAAHEAGVVHRDFKPENVLVGEDGRARVSDFGIARLDGGPAMAPRGHEPGASPLVTFDGALMGTPAYMSPEQFLGRVSDARSDQFAFCVALFEALCGSRPFEGDTLPKLRDQVCAGAAKKLPPTFPRRLERALRRGLQVEPDKRWPTMKALLDELKTVRRPTRRWLAAAAIGAALLSVAGVQQYRERQRVRCAEQEGRLAGIWDEATREQVRQVFLKSGRPSAGPVWKTVESTLDEFARSWLTANQRECLERVAGGAVGAGAEATAGCLERQLGDARALVDIFRTADGQVVDNAARAALAMRDRSECSTANPSVGALPPGRQSDGDAVRALRLLSEGQAFLDAKKTRDGLERATEALALARSTHFDAAKAEALYLLAQGNFASLKFEPAHQLLREAVRAADAARHDVLRARALMLDGSIVGWKLGRTSEGRELLADAAATLKRFGSADDLQGELHRRTAVLFRATGDYAAAISEYELAFKLFRTAHGDPCQQCAEILWFEGATYLEAHNPSLGIAALEASIDQMKLLLGDDNPDLVTVRIELGFALAQEHRITEAEGIMSKVVATLEKSDQNKNVLISVLSNWGDLLLSEGRTDEAVRALDRAVALGNSGTYSRENQLLTAGLAHVVAGDEKVGTALLQQGLDAEEAGRKRPVVLALARLYLARASGQWRVNARARAQLVVLAQDALKLAKSDSNAATDAARIEDWLRAERLVP